MFLSGLHAQVAPNKSGFLGSLGRGDSKSTAFVGETLIDKIDGLIWGHKISWEKREAHFHNNDRASEAFLSRTENNRDEACWSQWCLITPIWKGLQKTLALPGWRKAYRHQLGFFVKRQRTGRQGEINRQTQRHSMGGNRLRLNRLLTQRHVPCSRHMCV